MTLTNTNAVQINRSTVAHILLVDSSNEYNKNRCIVLGEFYYQNYCAYLENHEIQLIDYSIVFASIG